MIIRKATQEDLQRIAAIYDEVHTREEAGEVTTGWIRNVYPVQISPAGYKCEEQSGERFLSEARVS